MKDCILCDFQKLCADRTLFLYAATPILRQIVESTLKDLNAEFKFKNDLFALGGDFMQTIQALRGRLSDAERADIRVSNRRDAAMLV